VTAVTSQTERAPGSSSVQAWRYSAHELGAIDLIARERLHSCRDDVAWGDLWSSFDPLSFGLRSVMNAARHAPVIAPGGAGLALEKDSEAFPAFADDPAHIGSLQLVRRQNVEHDGRAGAVTPVTGRKQKGRPKPPLSHKRDCFVHDTSGESTIIASQARISSDARPQSATCFTQTIAEAFVAGLVESKEENAASSSVSSSRNRRSSAAAPSSAFA
jgi:hypothetical protein